MARQTLRSFVETEFEENSSYRVFLSNGHWLCPYCRTPVAPRPGYEDNVDEGIILAVCGHLGHGCSQFNGGNAVAQDVQTLQRAANILEFSNFIQENLKSKPAWQMFDEKKRWWCPYSAEPVDLGVDGATISASVLIPAIRQHLKTCKGFKGGKGKELEADKLRRVMEMGEASGAGSGVRGAPPPQRPGTAASAKSSGMLPVTVTPRSLAEMTIRKHLTTHPSWQIFSDDGRWLCPYSAKWSPVRKVGGAYTVNHRARDTLKWLLECPEFKDGQGVMKDAATLQAALAKGAAPDLALTLRSDPVWQCADDYGYWLCPYCRLPQVNILLSIYNLDDDTVAQVRAHVEEQCEVFAAGEAPAASVEEVYNATGRKVTLGEDLAQQRQAVAAKSQRADETIAALNKARTIQMKMIPKKPKIQGLEVEIVYRPHSEVSGDFYDFIQVNEDEWGFLLADVSGHGLEAAFVMSMAQSTFRTLARGKSSPKEAACQANDDVQPRMLAAMFFTAFYGIYNTRTRVLRHVRCGHNPTIVVTPGDAARCVAEYSPEGMALGMVKGAMFHKQTEEQELILQPGQILLQYTDGIIEAMDQKREEYGPDRFRASLKKHAAKPLADFLRALDEDVMTFTKGIPVDDDVTFLAFKVL